MEQKVLAFIRQNKLLRRGEKVVAAVSGGPDSVCLLYALANLRDELGFELHIAHLNHQLRGKESDGDAAYVAGLARKLKIPATIESADVKAYRKEHKLTLEEAAREVRYSFLADVMRKTGARAVAAGHTSDDNVETILMHLVRGTGINGLRGMPPKTVLNISGNRLPVIRPLICLNREETVAYCKMHRLNPRLDSSNFSTEPFRNKVRRKLLPELRKYNPRISEALLRTAFAAGVTQDFIEETARLVMPEIAVLDKESVILDKSGFLKLHPALQRQILRDVIELLLGNLKDIDASHIEDIIGALSKPAGKIIGLPFGLTFHIDYDRFVLSAGAPKLCPFPVPEKVFSPNVPGETNAPGWKIKASFVTGAARLNEKNGFTALFDAAAVGKKLLVRSWLPGDRFQPLGMTQQKKLNRFMMDEKIPRPWRKNIPIVCAGKNIIWVVGYRIDERFSVIAGTKRVLKLEFKKAEG